MTKKRIALFGGTFDPIHLGHTTIVRAAAEYINARKVIFIPAKQTALKTNSPVAGDDDRLKMIQLAVADDNHFEVSDYELNKPAPAYTLDTVLHFKQRLGSEVHIYWLVGADSVKDLSRWYKIEQLIDECFLCIMYRAGYNEPDFSHYSDLWGDMLGAEVMEYIKRHKLYGG